MFGLVLLLHAVVASAFCTEVALWVPWNGDTVDKVADALHLKNYETLVELNANFNVDSIERGKTYTVPYTKVDPPATWATVDGCTPLLLLNADATSTLTSTSTSTRASSKSAKSEKTSMRSTLETRARTDARSSPSTFTGKAEETVSTRASSVTSLESRSTATSDTRTAPSTATTSETSETSLPPSSQTETPSTTTARSSLNALASTETEAPLSSERSSATRDSSGPMRSETSSPPQSSETKTPEKVSSVDGDPTTSHGDSSYTPQATTEAEATTNQGTRTATRVVATTVTLSGIKTVTQTTTKTATKTATATATKTITQGSSAGSSSGSSAPSVVCHPDGSQGPGGSHNTNEKTLDKNAKKFCKEVKDVSLSKSFESVQMVYGKSTEMYIFTVSWVRGCDGKEQGVGTEDVCYKRIMGNWNSCNNKGQGGSTRSSCIELAYRPGAIVGADD